MKTQLKDRTLWYDGTSEVTPDRIPDLILSGVPIEKITAFYTNEDVDKFNRFEEQQISLNKTNCKALDLSWNIPLEYAGLELENFLYALVEDKQLTKIYRDRVKDEMQEIKNRKLENLFRTIIYVVEKFKEKNCVWGVGRGSSCASLILFLIGLHKVDPIKYNISYYEFFHD